MTKSIRQQWRHCIGCTTVFIIALGLSGGALADYSWGGSWGGSSGAVQPKNQFNIMMNYELGMHCTGFEFAYCCVLPVYNSIIV